MQLLTFLTDTLQRHVSRIPVDEFATILQEKLKDDPHCAQWSMTLFLKQEKYKNNQNPGFCTNFVDDTVSAYSNQN